MIRKEKRATKGITLIALVVTIVVLLILAGVTINAVLGDNGIIAQAQKATDETKRASYQDTLDTFALSLQMQAMNENLSKEDYLNKFKEEIEQEKLFDGATVTDGEEEGFLVETEEHFKFQITEDEVIYLGKGDEAADPKPPKEKDETEPNGASIEIAEDMMLGESITVKVTQTDNEGGSGIDYEASKWVFNEQSTPLGTEDDDIIKYTGGNFGNNNNPQTQIELRAEATGEYYLHVLSVDKAGNKKETVSNKVTVMTEKEAKIGILGGYVDFGLDLNGRNGTTDDWRVFYIGGINEDDPDEAQGRIYIIAADYVPNTNSEIQEVLSEGVIEKYTETGYHTYYWSNESKIPTFNYYDGFKWVGTGSQPAQTIFPELFIGTRYYCSNHVGDGTGGNANARAVGVLQNTSNWQPFITNSTKSSLADKAIGGPTLEMWVKSWNAKHGNSSSDEKKMELYFTVEDKLSPGTDTGYYVGNTTKPESGNIEVGETTGYNDTLYFPHKEDQNLNLDNIGEDDDRCTGYWLSSPSAMKSHYLLRAYKVGAIGYGSAYDNDRFGLRPIIALNASVHLVDSGYTAQDTYGTAVKLYNIVND